MTTYTLPISLLTNVEIGYQPPLLTGDAFGRGLIVGTSSNARVAPNELYGIYSTIDAVKADYGVEAQEYLIAKRYFEQNPKPKDVMIYTVAGGAEGAGGVSTAPFTDAEFANASFAIQFVKESGSIADGSQMTVEAIVEKNGVRSSFNETFNIGGLGTLNVDQDSINFYEIVGFPPSGDTLQFGAGNLVKGRFKVTFNPPQSNFYVLTNSGAEPVGAVHEFVLNGANP